MAWSSSLPDDFIRAIGEIFLATNDLDVYVDFRGACRDWRRATPNPRENAMNPKFMPRKWIMDRDSLFWFGKVTFINLCTWRSICKSLSHVLHEHFFLGVTTDGLLVLEEEKEPSQIRVLNPFTGALVQFKAGAPKENPDAVAVTLFPMRVFYTSIQRYYVRFISETTEDRASGWGFRDEWFGRFRGCRVAMTPFAGDMYTINFSDGSIISATDAADAEENQRQQPPAAILGLESYEPERGDNLFYLVESEGELLFILDRKMPYYQGGPLVYKVDAMNKVLVPVWSFGTEALFVSKYRSLSVEASNLRTVEAGSIYYADYSMIVAYDYESIPDGGWVEAEKEHVLDFVQNGGDNDRPFSLAQLLMDHCRIIE